MQTVRIILALALLIGATVMGRTAEAPAAHAGQTLEKVAAHGEGQEAHGLPPGAVRL